MARSAHRNHIKAEQKMQALLSALEQVRRRRTPVGKIAVPFVAPYEHAHKDVKAFPVAHIASNLGPKLNPVLRRGSRLCAIGYDGATLAKKGYIWRNYITKWLKRGCNVDYFLNAPAPSATAAFSKIARELPKGAGRLRVFVPKKGTQLPRQFKSKLTEWITFHFVVSENPSTLWIETNHQTSEPEAFGCYFFPETAANETGLGEAYLRRFDRVINKACDEMPFG